LANELKYLVKQKFAAHAYPRTVHFIPDVPKTPSGKLQRFVIRDRRKAEIAARALAAQRSEAPRSGRAASGHQRTESLGNGQQLAPQRGRASARSAPSR
jgi:hypothetical protein